MSYNVGDKVRVKSLDWYNENKDEYGTIIFSTESGDYSFIKEDTRFCGRVVTITYARNGHYFIAEDDREYFWIDEMLEGLVEEETKNNNDSKEKETLLGWVKESDNLRLVPHKDYEIKQDGDNFYLVKKKKEYPKTYEECCKVLNTYCGSVCGYNWKLLLSFQQLLICRDAYWKLYGEEMGLEKPWEPDWYDDDTIKYCIIVDCGIISKQNFRNYQFILAFPTAEMRDAFYENFKKETEICKEFL